MNRINVLLLNTVMKGKLHPNSQNESIYPFCVVVFLAENAWKCMLISAG